jgi:dihydrofolate reductase
MKITLIAAVCKDSTKPTQPADLLFKTCGLGKNNSMPWHLPEDLAFFKRTTLNHTIVMGRKTFESIGKALPGRRTLVLTRDKNAVFLGAETINSVEKILEICSDESEIFIVGGAEIYKEFLQLADRLLLTRIDIEVACDAHFPFLASDSWTLKANSRHTSQSASALTYEFCEFIKKSV